VENGDNSRSDYRASLRACAAIGWTNSKGPLPGDRGFESRFLQRGVHCESTIGRTQEKAQSDADPSVARHTGPVCRCRLPVAYAVGPNYNLPWELQDPSGNAAALARAYGSRRVLTKLRASSFAALLLAPRISTSSAASLVSSQARARSIRERLATEVTTVVVMSEG
jgi:hypothetical protein